MFYVLDENKNLIEGYDKQGVLSVLEQAIENGDLENIDEDSAFVSKIKSLLNGTTHHIEFVTQAQYNALEADEQLVPNTYYFITDDTTVEDLEEEIGEIKQDISDIQDTLNVSGIKKIRKEATTIYYDTWTTVGAIPEGKTWNDVLGFRCELGRILASGFLSPQDNDIDQKISTIFYISEEFSDFDKVWLVSGSVKIKNDNGTIKFKFTDYAQIAHGYYERTTDWINAMVEVYFK